MANISALLEIIRTAHLGRDMRQALHDSIEAVNNDTETALGKSLVFNSSTKKLSLKAKDNTVLSEVTLSGGSGSVNSVNNVQPDANGNVTVNLADINDVNLNSPTSGQVLKYDGEKWVNGEGGGGGDMLASTYDPNGDVAQSGGIPSYVSTAITNAISNAIGGSY